MHSLSPHKHSSSFANLQCLMCLSAGQCSLSTLLPKINRNNYQWFKIIVIHLLHVFIVNPLTSKHYCIFFLNASGRSNLMRICKSFLCLLRHHYVECNTLQSLFFWKSYKNVRIIVNYRCKCCIQCNIAGLPG